MQSTQRKCVQIEAKCPPGLRFVDRIFLFRRFKCRIILPPRENSRRNDTITTNLQQRFTIRRKRKATHCKHCTERNPSWALLPYNPPCTRSYVFQSMNGIEGRTALAINRSHGHKIRSHTHRQTVDMQATPDTLSIKQARAPPKSNPLADTCKRGLLY